MGHSGSIHVGNDPLSIPQTCIHGVWIRLTTTLLPFYPPFHLLQEWICDLDLANQCFPSLWSLWVAEGWACDSNWSSESQICKLYGNCGKEKPTPPWWFTWVIQVMKCKPREAGGLFVFKNQASAWNAAIREVVESRDGESPDNFVGSLHSI